MSNLTPEEEDAINDEFNPAYWRGEESGVHGACMRIRECLDGKDSGAGVLGSRELEKVRRDVLELVRAHAELLDMARELAKSSSKAHEAMDAQGVPVCGLHVEDRMKCLIKRHEEALKEKDTQLEICNQTMIRLAHEAKRILREPKP
jgi:hypothetical protein